VICVHSPVRRERTQKRKYLKVPVWKLVSQPEGRKSISGIWKRSAEENMWIGEREATGVQGKLRSLMRNFRIGTPHYMLLGWPNPGGCDVQGTYSTHAKYICIHSFSIETWRKHCLGERRIILKWTLRKWSRDGSIGIALGYGLDDRGSKVRFAAGAGNFSLHHRVQKGSGAHPASYPMGTRVSFPGGKAAGAWSWPLTSI
jgi:hypothetical protein